MSKCSRCGKEDELIKGLCPECFGSQVYNEVLASEEETVDECDTLGRPEGMYLITEEDLRDKFTTGKNTAPAPLTPPRATRTVTDADIKRTIILGAKSFRRMARGSEEYQKACDVLYKKYAKEIDAKIYKIMRKGAVSLGYSTVIDEYNGAVVKSI